MHAASSSSKAPARQNKIVVSKMPVFGVAKVACKIVEPARYVGKMPSVKLHA